ncbi:hypothetical protein C922_03169 [Plasmodium inui San Antonio 1]|uniref:Uncharacterized protein n=1 Tax=Plasmodium inui San Antonio 1 TaxID=1237626 RepID=W7A4D5_9APIC|nr:hypothetical protein C922_03169 [Plasmodium inui San Antonio 1]EUD66535.1 hypothetical protein C922_03169 [Plasmodium inui San Antonio 1]
MKNANQKGLDILEHLAQVRRVVECLLQMDEAWDTQYVKHTICYFYFNHVLTYTRINDESIEAIQMNRLNLFLTATQKLKVLTEAVLYILKRNYLSYDETILGEKITQFERYEKENCIYRDYLSGGNRNNFPHFDKLKIKKEQMLPFLFLLSCSTYNKSENLQIVWTIIVYIIYTFLEKYNIKNENLENDTLYVYIDERYQMDGDLLSVNKVTSMVVGFYLTLLNLGKKEFSRMMFSQGKNNSEGRWKLPRERRFSIVDREYMAYHQYKYKKINFLFETICQGLLLILQNHHCANYLTFLTLDLFALVAKYHHSFIQKYSKEIYSQTVRCILQHMDERSDNAADLCLMMLFLIHYIKLFLYEPLKITPQKRREGHTSQERNASNYTDFLIYILRKNNIKREIMKQINHLQKYLNIVCAGTPHVDTEKKKKFNTKQAYDKVTKMYQFYEINPYEREKITRNIYKNKKLYFYKPFYMSKHFLLDKNEVPFFANEYSDDGVDHNEKEKIENFLKRLLTRSGRRTFCPKKRLSNLRAEITKWKSNKILSSNYLWRKKRINKLKPSGKFLGIHKLHHEIDLQKIHYNELNNLRYMTDLHTNNDVHHFNPKNYYDGNDSSDVLLAAKSVLSSFFFIRRGSFTAFFMSKSAKYLSQLYPGWAPWL